MGILSLIRGGDKLRDGFHKPFMTTDNGLVSICDLTVWELFSEPSLGLSVDISRTVVKLLETGKATIPGHAELNSYFKPLPVVAAR